MPSVLVIEDDPCYSNVMKVILQMEGFDVYTARNGPEGLARLSKIVPDLILCDIMMRDMDGYGVLGALKQESRLAAIPFIFVTALAAREDMLRGLSEGAEDYLTKPFTAEELTATVHNGIRCGRSLPRTRQDTDLSGKQEKIPTMAFMPAG